MGLTNKQSAFITHYLGDCQWNATQAARRAGYAFPKQQGSRLLSNVAVKQEIDRTLAAMGAVAEALMARWLERLGVDISPYVDDKEGLDLEALRAAGLGYLVKGYRKTKDGVTIILRDPDVAEDRLARHLGMFVERKVVTGKDGGPVEHRDVTRDLSQYTDEELAQLAAIARRTRGD